MAVTLFFLGLMFIVVVMLMGFDKQPTKLVFVVAPFMLLMAAAVAKYLGL